MSLRARFSCQICKGQANGFNYGVQSCNACKMFFRRANMAKAPIIPCSKNCSTCRYCRFQLCLSAGMTWNLPRQDSLPTLLLNLLYLDTHRQETFSLFVSMENLSLDDVILTSPKCIRKPLNFSPDFYDWATIDQICAIDFMKKFDFIEKLSAEELKVFIKNSYIQYIMLCVSMRAVGLKRAEAIYPDGVDVFPEEIKELFKDSPGVLTKVRCPLVAKIISLKLTQEEFVLLSAVLICNPGSPCFSEPNRGLISQQQKTYSSALLQYCLITYQQSGPSRFSDLLSLCVTINITFQDFGHVWITYIFSQPDMKIGRLFKDYLDYLLEKEGV